MDCDETITRSIGINSQIGEIKMYSLNVLISFEHPDGRIFTTGHDCHALSPFEVAELIVDYPENFAAGNSTTEEFISNAENMIHLANAYKQRGK